MKFVLTLIISFQLLITGVWTNTPMSVNGTRQSITNPLTKDYNCQDYLPCECRISPTNDGEPDSIYVSCFANRIDSFEVIQEIFQQSTGQITSFFFEIPYSEINNTLPADLLNTTETAEIHLSCPIKSGSQRFSLNIDPDAFNASKDYLQTLRISNCDLKELDYEFLKDFSAMKTFVYFNCINFAWESLPYLQNLSSISVHESINFKGFSDLPASNLPSWSKLLVYTCPNFQYLTDSLTLTTLDIEYCPLFNQWDVVAQLNQLRYISLIGLNEETINNALNALVSSSLVDEIIGLDLRQNRMKQIPSQIRHFTQLLYVYLSFNEFSVADKGSLTFITPHLEYLDLSSNNLNQIDSAAFQGNFSTTQITLAYNKLTRFESSVFKPILEQIVAVNDSGIVYINANPIECDCHLKWLFCDDSNYLERVVGGTCSNGTEFSNLTSEGFASCGESTTEFFNSKLFLQLFLDFLFS